MRLAAVALAALIATPAAGEELTAEGAWELFARGCEMALEDPADSDAIAAATGGAGAAGTTPDGFGTQGVMVLEDLDIGDSSGFASFNYAVMQVAGGKMGYCTLQVIRHDRGPLDGIEAVVDARQGDLVGNGTRHGGEISAQGATGLWVTWTAPGFPPDAVTLRTFSPMTMLTLNRYSADEE